MTVHIEDKAQKQLPKLPKHVQQKTYRQLDVFLDNPKHPSLAIKKMMHSPLYELMLLV
jgi:mRNA-degrading endonuclease RelE of RelBE toxin-antitoxin system